MKAANLSSGSGDDMPAGRRDIGGDEEGGGKRAGGLRADGARSAGGGGGLPVRTRRVIGPRLEVGRGGADKVDEVIAISCANRKKAGGSRQHLRFIQIP